MPAGVTPDPDVGLAAMSFFHSEHGVLVNRLGRRFVDETVGDHLNTMALLEQPDARALLICDERVHREWMLKPYVEGLEPIDKFALSYRHGARAATADIAGGVRRAAAGVGLSGRRGPRSAAGVQRRRRRIPSRRDAAMPCR